MPTAPLLGVRREANSLAIYLPQLYDLMSESDPAELRHWFVAPGQVVQPGEKLVQVWVPGRRISIPTPREVVVPHKVVAIAEDSAWPLHMGDFLIKLEPVESQEAA